ncbi:MAG: glucosidase [Planctomycetes bacterium]|nr:glucosidase [Planctomycetota bacterium]
MKTPRRHSAAPTLEHDRLAQADRGVAPWRLWGPYLSERQWGTVREDYSSDGSAWDHFSHDAARSRAYRWGEDGIAGVSDDQQCLCFALAMWNGHDSILKERLFGLTGSEGNHGEDCKEHYYYLDATPTGSYMKMLYKYPQRAYPYADLVAENRRRGKSAGEYELIDAGAFDDDRYFDVFVEYAKADAHDLLIRISVHNRGPDAATIHLLPQLWYRNTWSWGEDVARAHGGAKPNLASTGPRSLSAVHPTLGTYHLHTAFDASWLFTENETNTARLFGGGERSGYYKDAFHRFVVEGDTMAVNPAHVGTKAAARVELSIPAGESRTIRLRLTHDAKPPAWRGFDAVMAQRLGDADAFYDHVQRGLDDADARMVQRQAFAGMVWSKQYFYFDIPQWLRGDPGQPTPPESRWRGRNSDWPHLNNADVISMPDKWEYPWYAAWDLAFHCIPLAQIDPQFAKDQLLLLTREWYMHPNGQLPAYEWAFGDVNPPVHAWATWRVYELDREQRGGEGDRAFLEAVFHKLLLNFTWWVNRKDREGHNVFQGGFLGLDNIGVFDRSAPLPTGGFINQADGTSWMAMYALNLMRIALELARQNPVYQDMATKFFEHFLHIAAAMTNVGGDGTNLWDEDDAFFYDVLGLPDGRHVPLKVRSMVGLIPMFAVEVLDTDLLASVPEFKQRLEWFLNYRPDLAQLVSRWFEPSHWPDCEHQETRLLSLLRGHRLKALLRRMLDESEFLSDYGVRALSKVHAAQPYMLELGGQCFGVSYQPGESDSHLFGGNSNWRGPIWMPVNYLLIESLRRFDRYFGPEFQVECPVGSGTMLSLADVADELTRRLVMLFKRDTAGRRAVFGDNERLQRDPHFQDYIPFHEYFHGDTGRGVGASHQTGWTGLIASLLTLNPRAAEPEVDVRTSRPPVEAPAASIV